MKLLNRNNLAVTFAASTEESRFTLNAILVTDKETVAIDGHLLARVSLPTEAKPENFPSIEGFKPNGFKRALLPLDLCKELEKAIPRKSFSPVLLHAAITEHMDGDVQKVTACTTDLESTKIFPIRPVTGQFPAWDSPALWTKKQPTVDITLGAELLKSLATAACKFSDRPQKSIRLRFVDGTSAMRFDMVNSDGQEMNGLLMPMRNTSELSKFMPSDPIPDPFKDVPEFDQLSAPGPSPRT